MDKEKLKELRQLASQATEGPWSVFIDDSGDEWTGWPSISAPEDMDATIIHRAGFKQEYWGDWTERQACRNAEFIAAFNPNTVKELLYLAELALDRLAIPEGAAISARGTTYHGIEEIYHQMEEAEALHMTLDKLNVPRADVDGCVFSLYGRVEQLIATKTSPTTDKFLTDRLRLWRCLGEPAPMNELQSIAAWLRYLGSNGEAETKRAMQVRMALLMQASNKLAEAGAAAEEEAGIYDERPEMRPKDR